MYLSKIHGVRKSTTVNATKKGQAYRQKNSNAFAESARSGTNSALPLGNQNIRLGQPCSEEDFSNNQNDEHISESRLTAALWVVLHFQFDSLFQVLARFLFHLARETGIWLPLDLFVAQ